MRALTAVLVHPDTLVEILKALNVEIGPLGKIPVGLRLNGIPINVSSWVPVRTIWKQYADRPLEIGRADDFPDPLVVRWKRWGSQVR